MYKVLSVIFVIVNFISFAKNEVVYLIPGQGSDYRIYKNLMLDTNFEYVNINYHTPDIGISMNTFARELAEQIDTNRIFSLVGVSLGGMLAVEMSTFLDPKKVIIISSAKSRKELPSRYTFQRRIPIYKLVSQNLAKKGALILQPIFEPDRNKEEETCVQMLTDKEPAFLRRTIGMILNWDREKAPEGIIHIHGDNDHTLPYRRIMASHTILDGSHMMTLTRAADISRIINAVLLDQVHH